MSAPRCAPPSRAGAPDLTPGRAAVRRSGWPLQRVFAAARRAAVPAVREADAVLRHAGVGDGGAARGLMDAALSDSWPRKPAARPSVGPASRAAQAARRTRAWRCAPSRPAGAAVGPGGEGAVAAAQLAFINSARLCVNCSATSASRGWSGSGALTMPTSAVRTSFTLQPGFHLSAVRIGRHTCPVPN